MTVSANKSKKFNLIPTSARTPLFISWTTTIILILLSLIYYFISQPELPIFYTLARKSEQLSKKEFLFLFPLISLLLNIIHMPIISRLKKDSDLMLRLFTLTTTTLQIIFLIALVRIIIITY